MTEAVFECDAGYYCPERSTKAKSQVLIILLLTDIGN